MKEISSYPIETLRHSCAHLLASAVLKLFPDTKLGMGPSIENGFYYDFHCKQSLSTQDLKKIEKVMRKSIQENHPFTKIILSTNSALEKYTLFDQPYKREILKDLQEKGTQEVSLYQTGEFVDLCSGPHVDSSGEIPLYGFALDRIAGAYWKGDSTQDQLQRIYGLLFLTKEELQDYLISRQEAKKRDHKKLGKELDLFYFDDAVGKGLPLWTPKGTIIKHELSEYVRTLEKKYGYDHVETPFIGNEKLYKISGHLDHYKDNMYAPIDMDGEKFYLRPMACPHHIRLLQRKPLSYKDLPVRYAEIADYSRFEKSGELMGMIRLRKFQLTDGHLFVTPEQLKEEFKDVCTMIGEGMKKLGLENVVSYRFSKRDPKNKEKYYPDDTLWNTAEDLMKEALDEMDFEYKEAEDEAAFYGPKLDVQGKNVNGKEDTLFTAQIDFLLPEKFNILYTDKDGTQKRPVMIHRSTIGSLERIFAFLIEHYAGAFPLWLAPVQIALLPVSEKFRDEAISLKKMFEKENIRVHLCDDNISLGKRIHEMEKQKIPLLAILGEKEVSSQTLTLREPGEKKIFQRENVSIKECLEQVKKEIQK
jgi:threonyl-tRNA synthetase